MANDRLYGPTFDWTPSTNSLDSGAESVSLLSSGPSAGNDIGTGSSGNPRGIVPLGEYEGKLSRGAGLMYAGTSGAKDEGIAPLLGSDM